MNNMNIDGEPRVKTTTKWLNVINLSRSQLSASGRSPMSMSSSSCWLLAVRLSGAKSQSLIDHTGALKIPFSQLSFIHEYDQLSIIIITIRSNIANIAN